MDVGHYGDSDIPAGGSTKKGQETDLVIGLSTATGYITNVKDPSIY